MERASLLSALTPSLDGTAQEPGLRVGGVENPGPIPSPYPCGWREKDEKSTELQGKGEWRPFYWAPIRAHQELCSVLYLLFFHWMPTGSCEDPLHSSPAQGKDLGFTSGTLGWMLFLGGQASSLQRGSVQNKGSMWMVLGVCDSLNRFERGHC